MAHSACARRFASALDRNLATIKLGFAMMRTTTHSLIRTEVRTFALVRYGLHSGDVVGLVQRRVKFLAIGNDHQALARSLEMGDIKS